MLLDFSVSNFGPFRDRATLSMQATSFDEHPCNRADVDHVTNGILTSAAVFGANSSGKSYLFKAVEALGSMLSGMYEPGFRYPWYEPFRLCPDNSGKPTELEIRLIADGVLYDYSVSYVEDSVVSESLYHYPQGRRRRVFDRDSGKGIRKAVMSNTSGSSAYLTAASKLDDGICNLVRDSILSMSVVLPSDYTSALSDYDPSMEDRMLRALDEADFGIEGIGTDALSGEPGEEDGLCLRHSFGGSGCDGSVRTFPVGIESTGTCQMLSVMGPVLRALEAGGTVFIDGLGSSLHPAVTRWIAGLFSTDDNTRGAQLVFSTHDLTLMDTRDLFRRDQIYFTNKDRRDGSAELYSLSDFKGVRKDTDVMKSYLSGRFDAVPRITRRVGI